MNEENQLGDSQNTGLENNIKQTNNTINNAKLYRTAVYKTLDITTPQMIDIKKLDKAFYAQIKPVLMENYHTLNRLSKLTNQIKPSKKLVNVEKKKLKDR